MKNDLKLMCVLAHPDDESMGMVGILAKYSSEGIETHLLTATRGEMGRFGDAKESPGMHVVAKVREAELFAAANELGLSQVNFLNYVDGELDRADPVEVVRKIVSHLRSVKPHVVVSFGPEGAYGHPDHVAISQFTTAAVVCAADPHFEAHAADEVPHSVSKLYYMAWTSKKWTAYQSGLKDLKSNVDGVERRAVP